MIPLSERFQDVHIMLCNPAAKDLLHHIVALELYTDVAIEDVDVGGLEMAIQGWQCLRKHSLDIQDLELQCKSLYCEANAHSCLATYYYTSAIAAEESFDSQPGVGSTSKDDGVQEWADKARSALLTELKLLYRLSAIEVKHNSTFRSAFLCNYGNCLSRLGRTPEAISKWWLAVRFDPDNVAALVSYGQGCLKLAQDFPRHKVLLLDEAYLALKAAVSSKINAERYWGREVLIAAKSGLAHLLEWWSRHGVDEIDIQTRITKRDEAHKDFEAPRFVRQICLYDLLLTVAPRPLTCPSTARDEAFPEATGVRLLAEQMRLVNLLNTIKEDFSLSRYLLFQYKRDSRPQVAYSSITDYVTSPTDNEFGLRPGLIKSVVRTNIDAFDKVAKALEVIIKLEPQNPKRDLSFNTIWYINRDRSQGLREEIKDRLNFREPLFGLYSMHLAWDIDDGPLKSLRDLFVHDVGNVTGYAKFLKVRSPKGQTGDTLDLFDLAIESLRMLRGAYLILCQIANGDFVGQGSCGSEEAEYKVGVSLSDLLDLDDDLP